MEDFRHSLTGLWSGRYAYAGGWDPPVDFTATLSDADGMISGWTSEPDSVTGTSQRLAAFINGLRQGNALSFAKTYDGEGPLAHHVDYVGAISDDGSSVTGSWAMPGATGSFVMTRPMASESEIALADSVDLLDMAP
jgi:hypothetical protein